jgi:hypothetical protein
VQDYPDDYAGIDVRGKIVLLVRFLGVDAREDGFVAGLDVVSSIRGALDRGAAGVLFVDPDLTSYREPSRAPATAPTPGRSSGPVDPYLFLERESPALRTGGTPVILLDRVAAERLVAPLGIDLGPLMNYDLVGTRWERSASRELGVAARVEVPVRPQTLSFTSLVGEVPVAAEDGGRVVVWAARPLDGSALDGARADVIGSVARTLASRGTPFIFVDFDPRADSRAVRDALSGQKVSLVVVLDDLSGTTLRFTTANGDLVPAFDLYAQRAGARYEITRNTYPIDDLTLPFPGVRTMTIGTVGTGDSRADVAALIGYVAGRRALGAPDVPR